jgi:FKBP-type peptidyl-prolyl cis-trans isomerase FkpA
MKISGFIYIAVLTVMICCRGNEPSVTEKEIRDTEEALVGANRMLVQKDRKRITEYIKQRNLTLKESESGLWYGITQNGNGSKVQENMLVTLAYNVSLLNGTSCYSSDSLGLKQFRVSKGGVESGLEEGVLLLNEGSKAVFIMPPYLAHGLTGDGDKIPARSIIVYQVELIKAEQ